MKSRTLVICLILVLVLLIIVGSCASGKNAYVKYPDEELYGTWINTEYKGSTVPFTIRVFNPDWTFEAYRLGLSVWEEDVEKTEEGWIPAEHGTYKIEDKWMDTDGNAWYKIKMAVGDVEDYEMGICGLIRLSDSNNTFEMSFAFMDYPAEIDPNNEQGYYRIRYRYK